VAKKPAARKTARKTVAKKAPAKQKAFVPIWRSGDP
jgi:hypothetical protein